MFTPYTIAIVASVLAQSPQTYTTACNGYRENAAGQIVEIFAGHDGYGCRAVIEWGYDRNGTGGTGPRYVLFMACDPTPGGTCEACEISVHTEPNGDIIYFCSCAGAPQVEPE